MKKCAFIEKCGGCKREYGNCEYEAQLKEKQKLVVSLMKSYTKVSPILGMDNPYNYRNKVHAALGYAGKGKILYGTYEKSTHKIVPVSECLLDNPAADRIIKSICELAESFKFKVYDENTKRGLLRHILVRCASKTGEIMVTLVVGEKTLPSKSNFIKALTEKHPEITTIVLNYNDRFTSMVLGDRETVIYGKGYIEDVLCGARFQISSKSFYQVNSVQTQKLYELAMSYADIRKNDVIIDAYSGIGTIGIVAAKQGGTVTCAELNADAVSDARKNGLLNNLKNIKFINADAGEFMKREAALGNKCDVLFMDPPRSGTTSEFIQSVAKLSPKRIVYISCNPQTLARDVKAFKRHGYVCRKCTPVDMFPWTEHVETCVLLSKHS